MTIPPNAVEWGKAMDPKARKPWIMDLSARLEEGEAIETFDLDLSAEGAAVGVSICTGGGRDPVLVNDGTAIKIWFEVDPLDQSDPIFDGAGARIPIEVTFDNNTVPTVTDQLTYVLRIAQQ